MGKISSSRLQLICLLFFLANSFAWNPTLLSVEEQAPQTAFEQISVFQNAARPEYSVYLNGGLIYLPLPSQSALRTEWGIHEGFAFRQRIGMWLTYKFNSKEKNGFTYGLGWFGERHGWDNEDFLLIPHEGEFYQINQVHTFGLTIASEPNHFLFGGGLQYLNAKDKILRWWLLGTYDRFSLLPVFHKNDLQLLNLKIDLQARQLRGHADSWQNYLPDLELSLFSKDSVKTFISQNIFKQKFYLEGAFWARPANFAWAAFKFYPDPSRLLLALEATAAKKEGGDVFYGGGITLPFLRVAYNHSDYYENFFKSRGLWIVEFCLSIGTSGDSFFALSAPKAAPSEISKNPIRRTD
ncbi:MAG: hypothetical protein LBH25_08195 [Fibromonadaceae bacterium]|nr:hypothetical protein [Fibromonadaceae bacterium]